jgi:hypothetical protein
MENENTTNTTTTTTTTRTRERVRKRVKQFRALSPLSQIVSSVLLLCYVFDFSSTFNDSFGLPLTFSSLFGKPWTVVTSQILSPSLLVLPAVVGVVFCIEVLLKRAFVGSRVVCELLLVSSAVTGTLYFVFDFVHRTMVTGEPAEAEALALGPHGALGGLLVLCKKLKNELSDEEPVRRAAKYGPIWYLVLAVFLGGEINREERVFGVALFGVIGGNVYFRWRGRKLLGMNIVATSAAAGKSGSSSNASAPAESGEDAASGSESEQATDEELKKKKLREELGRKALMERMKQKETEEEKEQNSSSKA